MFDDIIRWACRKLEEKLTITCIRSTTQSAMIRQDKCRLIITNEYIIRFRDNTRLQTLEVPVQIASHFGRIYLLTDENYESLWKWFEDESLQNKNVTGLIPVNYILNFIIYFSFTFLSTLWSTYVRTSRPNATRKCGRTVFHTSVFQIRPGKVFRRRLILVKRTRRHSLDLADTNAA